jgi:PiT family inorganic phosphate transporter
MVKLTKYQGFSADLAAAGCLLLSSITGIPVSTTHTKTRAIMGVGRREESEAGQLEHRARNGADLVPDIPGCGLLGFLMAKLFMELF